MITADTKRLALLALHNRAQELRDEWAYASEAKQREYMLPILAPIMAAIAELESMPVKAAP